MSLPLPKVVADVGTGGSLVTSMRGINSLSNEKLLRDINKVKKDYAPLTTQAEAMSKMAYANAVMPQSLIKLMSNPAFVANMSEDQKRAMGELIRQGGMRQGNSLSNMPAQQQPQQEQTFSGVGQPSSNSFSNKIKNAFHALIDKGQPQGQVSNPFANPMMQQGQQGMAPQQSFQPSQMPPMAKPGNPYDHRPKDGVTLEGEQWYNKHGEPVYEEKVKTPGEPSIEMELTEGQRGPRQKTWSENAGEQAGIEAEGKELGRIRATSKKELDQDYQQALQLKQPFERITKILTNPKFQNLRKYPGWQKLQMNGKATFGTAEEKKLIGEFQAAARQVVSATVKGFGGRILASEIPLSESMKLSDNDSIEAMMGKAPVIEEFNEMTLQRSRIASKLMKEHHLDKGDALEQADKMVDGEAIRKKVEMDLNPINEEDIDYTAKANGMTREQVIERLRKEGKYNG